MLKKYCLFADGLDKFARAGMMFFLSLCAVLIFIQVIARYFFSFGFFWAEEAARYSGMFVALLGISPLTRTDSYLRVDLFYEKVKASMILSLVCDLFILLCLVILISEGWEYVLFGMKSKTPALRIPFGIVYTCIPIGAFLGITQTIYKWINRFYIKTEE